MTLTAVTPLGSAPFQNMPHKLTDGKRTFHTLPTPNVGTPPPPCESVKPGLNARSDTIAPLQEILLPNLNVIPPEASRHNKTDSTALSRIIGECINGSTAGTVAVICGYPADKFTSIYHTGSTIKAAFGITPTASPLEKSYRFVRGTFNGLFGQLPFGILYFGAFGASRELGSVLILSKNESTVLTVVITSGVANILETYKVGTQITTESASTVIRSLYSKFGLKAFATSLSSVLCREFCYILLINGDGPLSILARKYDLDICHSLPNTLQLTDAFIGGVATNPFAQAANLAKCTTFKAALDPNKSGKSSIIKFELDAYKYLYITPLQTTGASSSEKAKGLINALRNGGNFRGLRVMTTVFVINKMMPSNSD